MDINIKILLKGEYWDYYKVEPIFTNNYRHTYTPIIQIDETSLLTKSRRLTGQVEKGYHISCIVSQYEPITLHGAQVLVSCSGQILYLETA